MNISYKWLKEYVDFDLEPQDLAAALTSTGLEVGSVEEVETIRGGLKGLFVGKVLTCEEHPNSDHLHVTTVDLGKGEPQQIVCGAANIAAGQKVIVADLGCVLYDGDDSFTIKRSKLRGVESLGMICAEDEIGVGTSHDGIIVLPEDAQVGMPAAEYYQLDSDWLIEIDITANRADALSHYGVARDLYAWLKQNGYETSLHRPDCDKFAVDNNDLPIEVKIENPDACRRYACLSITDCEVKESPQWLKDRLNVIGVRPINNIVDITNYVMMAYGQPMHCFDADMVTGRQIIVKDKNEGKKFITLDGEEHTLGEHDLAICNAEEPMCIAGVFGGKGSGTYENTRNVVLESAYFHPTWIRKSARRHGLSTDSSFRFERGIDPNGTIYALKQAAILCKELAGGKVSMEVCDVYPTKMEGFPVRLNYEYADRLIGKQLGADTIKSIATSLEMEIVKEDAEGLDLIVPPYRVDVKRPCDVIEDILRIYGYNNVEIPSRVRSTLSYAPKPDRNRLMNLAADYLSANGFTEIMSNSLTRAAYYEGLESYRAENCVRILNPLSADLSVMRQTLLFNMLEAVQLNANRRNGDLKLYEFGNCYFYDEAKRADETPLAAYSEEYRLAIAVTGIAVPASWNVQPQAASFFTLRAVAEKLLRRFGIDIYALKTETLQSDLFGEALTMALNGRELLQIGTVSRNIRRKLDVKQDVFYLEMNFEALVKSTKKHRIVAEELSKFPEVKRDLALLVDKQVTFSALRDVAFATERKLLKSVSLFDVYEGDKLPEGKKSYALSFILEDKTRTLDEKAIERAMQNLTAQFERQCGAHVRA